MHLVGRPFPAAGPRVLCYHSVDTIDSPSFVAQTNTSGSYGSFSIDAAGSWSFNLDNASVQGLAAGESVTSRSTRSIRAC